MLTISDVELAFDHLGVGQGVPNVTVRATPLLQPLWRIDGETLIEDLSAGVDATTGQDGSWTLDLPWPSESSPDSVTWLLTRSDGSSFTGAVPEGVTDDMTIAGLVFGHGWALVGDTHPLRAIQGPPGQAGPDATTTSVGSVLVDQVPVGGHPVALTVPSRGAADGVAALDGDGLLPANELAATVAQTNVSNNFTAFQNIKTDLYLDVFNHLGYIYGTKGLVLGTSDDTAQTGPVVQVNNDGEMTASSGGQAAFEVAPTINQSGTAGYVVIQADVEINGTGSGGQDLLNLAVGGQTQFAVDVNGTLALSGTTSTLAPATGSAAALPPQPAGYLELTINGARVVIPYWLPS